MPSNSPPLPDLLWLCPLLLLQCSLSLRGGEIDSPSMAGHPSTASRYTDQLSVSAAVSNHHKEGLQ